MKKKALLVIKILAFTLIFISIFYTVTRTLRFKGAIGIQQMEDFYRLPDNSIDVLNIGSSHVGVNVDPEILLGQYGIKSYNLWASVQPTWDSYYYLVEALKTQTPELVCMETFIATTELEYSDYSRIIYNVMGIKDLRTRYDAIQVSAAEDLRKDLLLEWPTYHTRYSELSEDDFNRYFWNYKMSSGKIDSGYNSFVNEEPVIISTDNRAPLTKKSEVYLRKIIELCREKEIPLLLFTTPYTAPETDQQKYNRIAQIAEEYEQGVVYKNFLYDINQIPVDFAVDYADGGGHFNNVGIEKFTMYFGRYLKENFNITVRNEEYAGKFSLKKNYSCAYSLNRLFSGNATNTYEDTYQSLYDDPNRSWSLFADFSTEIPSEEKIYFSCFSEEENINQGLMVKREEDTLYIIIGDGYYVETEVPEDKYVRMAIIKDGTSYDIYLNGELLEGDIITTCDEYDGTLVLGCEQGIDGEPYRFSAAHIYEMEVYNEVVSEKDTLKWLKQERIYAKEVDEQIQDTVDFYLNQEFEGDGIDQYYDTGIHLYDDPTRNWTLLTEIGLKVPENSADYVYLSCFSEEENAYRGILLRQKDGNIELILGNNYYMNIPYEEAETMKVVVVKNGSTYTVYINGEEYASDISSFCSSYFGNLLIGCQESTGGEKMRFSPVTVKQLEVYDEIVPADEIATW